MGALLRRRARDERGTTLPELLVGVLLLGLVIGVPMTLVLQALRHERTVAERTDATRDARVTLERMTREIRQATSASVTDSGRRLTLSTYVEGTLRSVVYDCSSGTCSRTEAGAVTHADLVDVTSATDVFSAPATISGTATQSTSSPRFVEIRLLVDVPGSDKPIEVVDGARICNAATGTPCALVP